MPREFTAIVQPDRDGDTFSARCLELPGAGGRGRTADEALRSLAERLARWLQERRDDVLPALEPGAARSRVTVH
jgi:predicted RNase H-like HicB family nuclease